MDAAQTHASDIENDQTELKAARARLRALAALVAEAVESIDMPETFLEGERATRAVIAADRMVTNLPVAGIAAAEAAPNIAPARKRLRVYAHRLLDTIENPLAEDLPRRRTRRPLRAGHGPHAVTAL